MRSSAGQERLEVDVPDPGDVLPVGDRVVQRDHRVPRRAGREERAHHLVRAGRVLDQQDEERAVADADALRAAERRGEALETALDLLRRRAERVRQRRRRKRVVDVVEPREAQAHVELRVGQGESERRALEPVELDRPSRDVERRPRVPAGGQR